MAKSLVELREEIAAKNKQLHDIFQAHPEIEKMPEDVAKSIKPLNDEITALSIECEKLREIDAAKSATADRQEAMSTQGPPPGGHPNTKGEPPAAGFKTTRQRLEESVSYKRLQESNGKGTAEIEIPWVEFNMSPEQKTLITLTTINNQNTRMPGIVPFPVETRTVRDLMAQGTMDSNTIEYYEHTTFTNAAAPVAEGGTKPEAALGFTLRTDPAQVIAVWIPVTKQTLADVSAIQSFIEGQLRVMLQRTEETQLISGDGTSPNISGILDRSGIQTQAKGALPTPDAIYLAMTKIEVNAFADPDAYVTHPNDWAEVRLLRTTDGIYIWGSPADVGPERIWGLPVRKTTAIAEGTGLVGDFNPWALVLQREGVTITMSSEHSTYFIENKVAILAEERLALVVTRPAAFCTVTGI